MYMFDRPSCETIEKYSITKPSQLFTPQAKRNKELTALRKQWLRRLDPATRASVMLALR